MSQFSNFYSFVVSLFGVFIPNSDWYDYSFLMLQKGNQAKLISVQAAQLGYILGFFTNLVPRTTQSSNLFYLLRFYLSKRSWNHVQFPEDCDFRGPVQVFLVPLNHKFLHIPEIACSMKNHQQTHFFTKSVIIYTHEISQPKCLVLPRDCSFTKTAAVNECSTNRNAQVSTSSF